MEGKKQLVVRVESGLFCVFYFSLSYRYIAHLSLAICKPGRQRGQKVKQIGGNLNKIHFTSYAIKLKLKAQR